MPRRLLASLSARFGVAVVLAGGCAGLVPPTAGAASIAVPNADLENWTSATAPDCWSRGGYGSNGYQFDQTSDAHSGSAAEQLTITWLTSGDRKLLLRRDAGDCAPNVTPGLTYTVSAWYRGDAQPFFAAYLRGADGSWQYWRSGPHLPASDSWSQAKWRMPTLPAGTTNISFGLVLDRVGTLTTDDYALSAGCDKQTQWVAPEVDQGGGRYLYTPMSDAAAAACVSPAAENRPDNSQANSYVPSDAELQSFLSARTDNGLTPEQDAWYPRYVTGRPGIPNPTTDELIQWAAHKWGIPEDWLRAQYAVESGWNQDNLGDRRYVGDADVLLYPEQSRERDASGAYTGYVWESLGISQVKWRPDGSQGAGTEPLRWESTAFNIDYQASLIRFEYDNPYGMRASWGDSGYQPLQQWLSIGAWFQPYPWDNADQEHYVAHVQQELADRTWEQPGF